MALKQLLLSRKIEAKRADLSKLQEKLDGLKEKRAAMSTREAELEEAVKEITEETEEAVKEEVEKAVAEFEADVAQVEADQAETDAQVVDLQAEIAQLQDELDELNKKVEGAEEEDAPEPAPADDRSADFTEFREERKVTRMNIRTMFGDARQREALFARDDVKQFAERVRRMGKEKQSHNFKDRRKKRRHRTV